MTYKDRDQRRTEIIMALGLFDLTERDRRLIDWLSSWDQDTTDAVADLLARAASPGRQPITRR